MVPVKKEGWIRSNSCGSAKVIVATHLAGSCDLSCEESAEVVAGLHHCPVPADVRHRGQSIKRLDKRNVTNGYVLK